MELNKGLMAICLVMVTLCIGVVPVAAAEIEPRTSKDENWQFNITNATTWHSLGVARAKENSTSIYVNWETGGAVGSMQGRAFGVNADGSNVLDCGTLVPGDYHTYYIPKLGKYSLINYVYENHLPRAQVKVCGTGKTGYVSGKWSPDSVGSYTPLR